MRLPRELEEPYSKARRIQNNTPRQWLTEGRSSILNLLVSYLEKYAAAHAGAKYLSQHIRDHNNFLSNVDLECKIPGRINYEENYEEKDEFFVVYVAYTEIISLDETKLSALLSTIQTPDQICNIIPIIRQWQLFRDITPREFYYGIHLDASRSRTNKLLASELLVEFAHGKLETNILTQNQSLQQGLLYLICKKMITLKRMELEPKIVEQAKEQKLLSQQHETVPINSIISKLFIANTTTPKPAPKPTPLNPGTPLIEIELQSINN